MKTKYQIRDAMRANPGWLTYGEISALLPNVNRKTLERTVALLRVDGFILKNQPKKGRGGLAFFKLATVITCPKVELTLFQRFLNLFR